MAAGPRERLARLIKDVEKAARQLRSDIRKRAQGGAEEPGGSRRPLCARAPPRSPVQVEKYVHEIRVNLEGRRPSPAARRRPQRGHAPARRARARNRAPGIAAAAFGAAESPPHTGRRRTRRRSVPLDGRPAAPS